MLTEDDIKKLINEADNSRDKAFVAVLYETGCRIGEISELKIKNISFDDIGARLSINGKTGPRRIRIISSVPYLTEWINMHPMKDDMNSWVWITMKEKKQLKYEGIRKLLIKLKKKSGVKRAVNPHNFRHSRATYLAQYLTEAQMKEYLGWTQSSEMASVYVHLSGRDVDKAIFKIYGIENDVEKNEVSVIAPKKCSRCKEINETTNKFCKKCGFPLNEEIKNQIIRRGLEQNKASGSLEQFSKNSVGGSNA